MGIFIQPSDLDPFASIDEAKANAMIADAEAIALTVAPCLEDPDNVGQPNPALTETQSAVVTATLRAAILRWNDSGSGAVQQQTAGPYSETIDTRKPRRSMFWPSEIDQLQNICAQLSTEDDTNNGGAFAVDTVDTTSCHLAWCSLLLGATYCSCGVDIAGQPIFELG